MESRGTTDSGLIRLEDDQPYREAELPGVASLENHSWLHGTPDRDFSSRGIHPAVLASFGDGGLDPDSMRQPPNKGRLTGYFAIAATLTAIILTSIVGVRALSAPAPRHNVVTSTRDFGVQSSSTTTRAQPQSPVSSPSAGDTTAESEAVDTSVVDEGSSGNAAANAVSGLADEVGNNTDGPVATATNPPPPTTAAPTANPTHPPTVAPTPAPPPVNSAPAGSVPLYEYFNSTNKDHFYTATRNDSGFAYYGYAYSATIGRIYTAQVAGTFPLSEYWNPNIGDHFYTVDRNDSGLAAMGYSYSGNTGYVFRYDTKSLPTGLTALYRYWSSAAGDHYYTETRNDAGYAYFSYSYERVEAYLPTS